MYTTKKKTMSLAQMATNTYSHDQPAIVAILLRRSFPH